jgi:acyl-coenzyme A thioesterase PaaI-like protein
MILASRTHLKANPSLLGTSIYIEEGKQAVVDLRAGSEMAVDEVGLVHGGFTFGLADYAAMLAVNDPYVVLGSSEVRFTAPVKVGDLMRATATVESVEGKRRDVSVVVSVGERTVLKGKMACFVLAGHVLLPEG